LSATTGVAVGVTTTFSAAVFITTGILNSNVLLIHIDQSGMITFNNPFAVLTLKFVVQAPYLVGLLLSWFDTVDRVVFDVPGIAWWITSFLQALHYV
jgi:hypothetical protein